MSHETPRSLPRARRILAATLSLIATTILATPAARADELALRVLSNRADLISAGDALVEVVVPPDVVPADVRVSVNDVDATSAFGLDGSGRFLGLVTGLAPGDNLVEAFVAPPTLKQAVAITITNHVIGGPVFAGAQLTPFVCARKVVTSVTVNVPGPPSLLTGTTNTRASGLDFDPVDDQCNAPSKFTLYYQPKATQGGTCTFTTPNTANSCFINYDPNSPPLPADIADFTNDRGDTVKSIILVERGTTDRGIYELVTFYDPTLPSTPQNRQQGWNGKLLWTFGPSSGPRRFEAPPSISVFNGNALSRGFMSASGSLTDHDTNSNDTLAAEFLMMVKEHVIETYGEIRYTIGAGCSGGSILQYNIAAAYPGLLNGIQPNCTFPDTLTTAIEVVDCGLLTGRYYTVAPGNALTTAKRTAINGHANANQCAAWVGSFLGFGNPQTAGNCGSGWPATVTYNPTARTNGVRCDTFDHDVSMLGTFIDNTDGNTKVVSPLDNVGVQYGLKALASGVITAEEFTLLNENVGSYSADLVYQPVRTVASASALHTAYTGGLVSDGAQLAKTAIIDLRGQEGAVDIHLNWRALQVRARLDAANSNHDNQVIWASGGGITPGAAQLLKSFVTMDQWLRNIELDGSNTPIQSKIVSNKPAAAHDLCIATNGATDAQAAAELPGGLTDPTCPVKFNSSPHQVAGAPRAENIFKCQLKPLDFNSPDYNGVVFSAAQQTRLQAVYPDGVCDWTLAGVGQVPSDGGTTFENGPGGEPLGAAPASDLVPPVCGDGDVVGEACDDGNTTAGDGCSDTCAVEAGFSCTGSPSACTAICGDELVRGGETCDDGNTNASDGCSASCATETGYTCGGEPSSCTAICGDGLILGAEACDDGNTNTGDGCSASCATEAGYQCTGSPSTCTAICGDGLVRGGEACDDGNTNAADGCSSSCTTETGYTCGGEPSSCTAICGDGLILGTETCDDSNTNAGDGCSASCSTEAGYQCTGTPSTCAAVCGDGLIRASEACDDGNTNAGDGCSASCAIETGFACSGEPSACDGICGDGLTRGSENCDDAAANGSLTSCCSATCHFKANGTSCDDGSACTTADTCNGANTCVGGAPPDCDDDNSCTVDSCNPATGCVYDLTARNGFSCDDGNGCTQNETCSNGICIGPVGGDSDGDGYCDAQEITAGCNPNDGEEIPPQPVTFSGKPINGDGNLLMSFVAPATDKVTVATDPTCATAGVCGANAFCTAGKIGDHCTSNAQCNQPVGTCRIVANYAETPDLAVRKPFKLNKTDITPLFEPLTPGCTHKIDVTLDPAHHTNTVTVNIIGTASGRVRRDADRFRYK